jgi:hypothetical protein
MWCGRRIAFASDLRSSGVSDFVISTNEWWLATCAAVRFARRSASAASRARRVERFRRQRFEYLMLIAAHLAQHRQQLAHLLAQFRRDRGAAIVGQKTEQPEEAGRWIRTESRRRAEPRHAADHEPDQQQIQNQRQHQTADQPFVSSHPSTPRSRQCEQTDVGPNRR